MVYKWLRQALQRAFPFNCCLCGQPATGMEMDLCGFCHRRLPWLGQACYLCANPLEQTQGNVLCGRCIRKPPKFDRSYCALRYQEPVNWLVQSLKYRRHLTGIPVLSHLLRECLQLRVEHWPGLIIPVPLHPGRVRERGFNQALEIARSLSRALDIPVSARVCARLRDTPRQSELPAGKRAANVRNAFRIFGELPAKHIAIVDDVVTTGATVNEIARLLKRHGAESVQVWAVARTPR